MRQVFFALTSSRNELPSGCACQNDPLASTTGNPLGSNLGSASRAWATVLCIGVPGFGPRKTCVGSVYSYCR